MEAGAADERSPSELRRAVQSGVAWKLAAVGANQGLRLVTILAIARFVTPREFGLAAIALSFWAVASVITDLPVASALVQRAAIDEDDRSTAFWVATASGLVLGGIGIAVSGPVAAFFGESEVRWLVAALAVGVALGGLVSTHVALFTRAMDFRALETISVVATAGGAVVGIALAVGGAGPWALIGNALAVSALSSVLVWRRSAWRPRLRFSVRSLRRLSGFASLLFAARVLAALQRSADRLLIGRYLGAPALGAYAVPSSIVAVPAARLVDPIRAVLFPALSRLQDSRSELARAWLRVTRLVFALLAPVLVVVAAGANEIVELALTSQWSEAAPVLRVLALAAVFQLAGAMNAVVLTALGRLSTVVGVFSVTAALSIVGFAIGQEYGLEGAAAGYAAATVITAPFYLGLTARALGLTAREAAAAYTAPAAGLLAMTLVVAGVQLAASGLPAAARLAAVTVLPLAVYAVVTLRGSRELRADIWAAAGRPRR